MTDKVDDNIVNDIARMDGGIGFAGGEEEPKRTAVKSGYESD
jgi:hypothetical protein